MNNNKEKKKKVENEMKKMKFQIVFIRKITRSVYQKKTERMMENRRGGKREENERKRTLAAKEGELFA